MFKLDNDKIIIVPTTVDDLDYVTSAEICPANSDFVGNWSINEHKQLMDSSDGLHLVVKDKTGENVGFVIIRGLENPNGSVELMRLVVTEKSKGYGPMILDQVKTLVFEKYAAHRLWLDVVEHNERARKIYERLGFVKEGMLRESDLYNGVYRSQIIMSILKKEYFA